MSRDKKKLQSELANTEGTNSAIETKMLPVSESDPDDTLETETKNGPRVFFVHLEPLSSNLNQTLVLARALSEDGWDIHIVCTESCSLVKSANSCSLTLHTLPDGIAPSLMTAWKLTRIVGKEWRNDLKKKRNKHATVKSKGLVHACDPTASQLVSKAWRIDKNLRIVHTRRVPIMEVNANAVRCYQIPPAKVITDSLAGKIALRLSGLEAHNLHAIACGIDPAAYILRTNRKDGRVIFVVTLELASDRGYSLLFEALDILDKTDGMPPWELRILGEGPSFPDILKEAQDKNVAERLAFLGGLNAADQLSQCDILVLPASEGESHVPLILQGWAAHIPVIAINRLDHAEILQDEGNALLVQPNAAAALASQMIRLANDNDLRAKLTVGGKEALSKFPLTNMILEHKRLYGQIMA